MTWIKPRQAARSDDGFAHREITPMDPLSAIGLLVVAVIVGAAGFWVMKPEKY